jgi:hypothetical protein
MLADLRESGSIELVSRAFDAGIEFVDADSIRKPEPKLDLAEGELPF